MTERWERTKILIGETGVETLEKSSVIIFGTGGVGSFAVEALARAGIGRMALVDPDIVSPSDLNRQLPALHSTLGKPKVLVLKKRIEDINPQCEVKVIREYYQESNREEFFHENYNYVVDAIDSLSSKISLIEYSLVLGLNIVSAMGAGNRLDPMGFLIRDISETVGCPLAKIVRRELRKKGIETGVKTVFSPNAPISIKNNEMVGSISFVPPVVGMMLASVVVNDILNKK